MTTTKSRLVSLFLLHLSYRSLTRCLFPIQWCHRRLFWSQRVKQCCRVLTWRSAPLWWENGRSWPGVSERIRSSLSLTKGTWHRTKTTLPDSALPVTAVVWRSPSITSAARRTGASPAPCRGRLDRRRQIFTYKVRQWTLWYNYDISLMTLDSLVFVTWKDTCCPAAPLWPLTSVWRKITRRGSSPWEFKLYAEWYNILLKVLIVKLKKKKKKSSHFLRAHYKRLSVWLWGRCNDKCVLWRAAEVIHLSFQQPLVTASNGIWWKTWPRMLSRRNKTGGNNATTVTPSTEDDSIL